MRKPRPDLRLLGSSSFASASLLRRVRQALTTELHSAGTRHSLITFAGLGIRFGLSFIASVILARSLGPVGYGVIALVSAVFSFVDTFGDFGLTYTGVRAISRNLSLGLDRTRSVAQGFFSLALLANLAAALAGILLAEPIARIVLARPEVEPYLRLALLGVITVTGSGFVTAVLQATHRFTQLALVQISSAFLYLAGILALVASGNLNVVAVVLLGVVNPIIVFLIGLAFLPPRLLSLGETFTAAARRTWAELASFSKWIWISGILSLAFTQLDLVLLSHLARPASVGLYALASNLTLAIGLVNQTRFTVLLPRVSTLATAQQLSEYSRGTLKRGLLLSLPLALIGIFAAPFIQIVYGPAYVESVPAFLTLLVVLVFDLLTTPLILLVFPLNAPKVAAASDAIRVLSLAAAGVFLIPGLGLVGAALARLLAKVLGAAFTFLILWQMLPDRQLQPLTTEEELKA